MDKLQLSPEYPEDLPKDHVANKKQVWRAASASTNWRLLALEYLFHERPCRLTLRGNDTIFAFDIPLPVLVRRQRFQCSTHAHLTKRQFDPKTNRSTVSSLHSATITQSHPDFNHILLQDPFRGHEDRAVLLFQFHHGIRGILS
jgi:hypothetical protein